MAKAKAAPKTMTKGDIISHLSMKVGTTKKAAQQYLEEFVALAHKEAKKGFTIPGLGKLSVGKRKKRIGRNPQTGEAITIPAKNVVKFKVGKQAHDAVFPGQIKAKPKAKAKAKPKAKAKTARGKRR